MSEFDWSPYLVGGATRPDALNFDPAFADGLARMFMSAPENIRAGMRLTSGYRSPEVQAGLWEAALQKYGSEAAARKWVAPPGRSNHNHGTAADLKFVDPAAQEWVHANAAKYSLAFPLSNEPWHVEPIGARGSNSPALSFGSSVPAMGDPTLAGMFDLRLMSMGEPVADAPIARQQKRQEQRKEQEDTRRVELAKLIRF